MISLIPLISAPYPHKPPSDCGCLQSVPTGIQDGVLFYRSVTFFNLIFYKDGIFLPRFLQSFSYLIVSPLIIPYFYNLIITW